MGRKKSTDREEVAAYLSRLDKERLVEMVVELAIQDEGSWRKLRLEAAQALGPPGRVVATVRRAIQELLGQHLRGEAAYGQDLAPGLSDLVDELDRLCRQGYAAEVVDLAEQALGAGEAALEFVDDSDGLLGTELERLQAVHHQACRVARPDPVGLARRLFEAAMRAGGYTAFGSPKAYADVLGKAGLQVYRRLAEGQWQRLPALGPGERDENPDRYRLTRVMEELAELSGDVEALVAVKRRDLSNPSRYLDIAETYRRAGQHQKALRWAEEGLRTFGPSADGCLRRFVIDAYHRLGRHGEAVALAWAAFEARPGYEAYEELRECAQSAGQWDGWRKRALELARERLGAGKRAPGERVRPAEEPDEGFRVVDEWDASLALPRILLSEGLLDEAWRHALCHGCSERLWVELAARREAEHPQDAVRVYQAVAELRIARGRNEDYEEAVELVGRVRAVMERMGRRAEFSNYLAALRARHRRRRNLMKLLPAK